MRNSLLKIAAFWNRVFLEDRPSIGLSFFRLAVAFTAGAHVIPTLLQFQDNYSSWAFKQLNASFFPVWFLELVARSPDGLARFMGAWFVLFWFLFLIGLWSQISCIGMTIGCYYFYALNSLHIGTLSFDILLVTLFLMCVSPYHGDYFSVDSILRGDPDAYRRERPYFIQRLLQMQIANTFFYTALCKVTAQGNWITGNPYYYLMNSPAGGVVRDFPGRLFLAHHPSLCYGIGVGVFCFEFAFSVLVFVPQIRWWVIPMGIFFHCLLLGTLHVPTIFFFLFPAQMLLFINPERIVEWIGRKRASNQSAIHDPQSAILLYDGRCGFCRASLRRVRALDLFGALRALDLHAVENPSQISPGLTRQACLRRIHYAELGGNLSNGFYAFRRIALRLPTLWWIVPVLYLPGMGWIGQRVYDWVARRRHRLSTS